MGFFDTVLANMFLDFFHQRLKPIVEMIRSEVIRAPLSMPTPHDKVLSFQQVSQEEVTAIILMANVTYCDSDPLPISDISQCE